MSQASSPVPTPSAFTINTRITENAMTRLDEQRRRMAFGRPGHVSRSMVLNDLIDQLRRDGKALPHMWLNVKGADETVGSGQKRRLLRLAARFPLENGDWVQQTRARWSSAEGGGVSIGVVLNSLIMQLLPELEAPKQRRKRHIA